jgi:hypothetical protein
MTRQRRVALSDRARDSDALPPQRAPHDTSTAAQFKAQLDDETDRSLRLHPGRLPWVVYGRKRPW